MKLLYECPMCGKEFTKPAKNLIGSSTPIRCPHCEEVLLIQWKRLITEENTSTLSK
jgi:DNA-directed RNA polymerase subunit RPC12/RpoP